MRILIKNWIYIVVLTLMFACKANYVQVTKKEYNHKKSDGFWVIKNKKAINHNQTVTKPKRDRQLKRIASQNKRILKHNEHHKKKITQNEELLKIFDHH